MLPVAKRNATLLVLILAATTCSYAEHAARPEQTSFSAEDDGVRRPVPLPAAAIAALSRDKHIQERLQGKRLQEPPRSWFSASAIHLGDPGETDFVVMGIDEMRGANVTTFWVLRPVGGKYSLIVRGAAVHDFVVTTARTNGYRDIQILSATATTWFSGMLKFDGTEYRLKSGRWRDIN